MAPLIDLGPSASFLAAGVALDLLFGDPVYSAHPVRVMGSTLTRFEKLLRSLRLDSYGGGILLFLLLSVIWAACLPVVILFLPRVAANVVQIFLIYSLLALRDLLRHGWNVERAASACDLPSARAAISKLVGRDTSKMDFAACRRAAIESFSENLTDGFISPIFWYAIGGLPAMLLFKVVSTMDSMVGYKTDRYLRFGWCGARTDDLMNWIPARLTWLLLAAIAAVIPDYSAGKALRIGWQQHAIVPGPNSGWSEAATAGAINRRLVGPIWSNGTLVTEVWLGDAADPPASESRDFRRASTLILATALAASALAIAALLL